MTWYGCNKIQFFFFIGTMKKVSILLRICNLVVIEVSTIDKVVEVPHNFTLQINMND